MKVLESVITGAGENPNAPPPAASVLTINDEANVRKTLSTMLQADGYAVVTVGSGKEAWAYTLALALAVVMTGGFLHFHIGRLYQEETGQWQARQSSIAEDRAQRVSDWLTERQADAELISSHPAVMAALQAHHDAGQLPRRLAGDPAELTVALDELAGVYYYNGVYLLDSDAHLVAQSKYSEPLSPQFAEISRTVVRTGILRPEVLSDARGKTLVSFSAPVFSRQGITAGVSMTDQPRGAVVLVVDASQTLFPLVTHESIPTRTGEALLVCREGDDIVFFSPLRRHPAGSPNLRFPLSTAPLPARVALEGHETFMGYNDYRGVPVLAATRYIRSAGWGLVNKIDRTEAYENVRHMAVEEELAAGLLIILLGGLLAYHRRTTLMRALKQKEGEFRALLESAPDAMAITDGEGRIVLVNAQAEILFGYKRQELIGRPLGMLFPEWVPERSGEGGPYDFSKVVARHVGKTFEMRGLRKGGMEFPSEVRLSPVKEIEGGLFCCGIRDISERKQGEQALSEAEEQFRSLFASIPLPTLLFDAETLQYLEVNAAAVAASGYSRDEFLQMRVLDLSPLESQAGIVSQIQAIHPQSLVRSEGRYRLKDGRLVDVESDLCLLDFRGRRAVLSVSQDVTARKHAEATMAERHRLATLVAEVGVALTGAESLRRGLQRCAEILVRDIDAAFARVWTVNDEEKVLELEASAGLYTHIDGGHARVPVGKFKIGRIAENSEPHLTNSVQEDSWVGDPEWARREGMVAFAGYPLKVDEQVLGVVAAFARKPLTEATLQAFAAVADNLAQFIKRKRAEEALRESEKSYRLLFENNLAGVLRTSLDGRILGCNQAMAKIVGFDSPQEALAHRVLDFYYSAEDRAFFLARLKAEGYLTNFEMRLRRNDGSPVWLIANIGLSSPSAGSSQVIEGTLVDITERKHAEQLAHLLTTALESAANGIMIANRDGRIIWVNPAFTRLSGYSAAEVVGQTPRIWKSGAQDKAFYQQLWKTVLAGEVWQGEIVNRRKDGTEITEGMTITPVRDALGTISHFIAIKEDITGRKRAEEEVRASEACYRELFENASDIVYTTDLEMRMTSLNRVGQKTLGYSEEEATQLSLTHLIAPKYWETVNRGHGRLLAGETDLTAEIEVSAKDGRPVMLEVKPRLIYKGGKPVGVQGTARDITGRDVAEMELRHAQKLESVGRLASGIAHEINTPIQFVGDNTRFLQESFESLQSLLGKYQELRSALASGAASPEFLAEVQRLEEASDCAFLMEEVPLAITQTLEGVDRVATIVRAMKEFAHPEGKEMAAADLNKALLSTLTVARNELKYVADVETEFGELPMVVCNIGDLNQVFLNLLVNAAHAIGDVVKGTFAKGKIHVRTQGDGSTVLLSISDTGCGIAEANRSKVFDPFFTTKEVGRGTGQGLAIARTVVVERHKGALTFESEVGKGTTFYIRLPIDPGECSRETRAP